MPSRTWRIMRKGRGVTRGQRTIKPPHGASSNQMSQHDAIQEQGPEAQSGKRWNDVLGMLHIYQGKYDQGLEEIRSGAADPPTIDDLLQLAYALGRAGKRREALQMIDQLERKTNADAVWVAIAWTGIGNKDKAFEWLNRALTVRSPSELWIGVFPALDPLRSDPRFKELLNRMGLP